MKKITILMGAMVIAGAVNAGDNGPYIGIGVGNSELESCSDCSKEDNKDTQYSVTTGWAFNENFALELAYRDLGDFTAEGYVSDIDTNVKAKASGEAMSLVVMPKLPIAENFYLYGKLGAVYTWGDISYYDLDDDGEKIGSLSGNGWSATGGVGAGFDISDNFSIRAEVSRIQDVAELDADLDIYEISALYKF